MPESTKVLRRRVRSISNTKQITRAMEMVSAAKLRRTQATLLEARPYSHQLGLLLGRLAPSASVDGLPFFQKRNVKRTTLVVFTADRGLCGSYNSNVIRITEKTLQEAEDVETELVCIGRRGAEYFSRRQWPVAAKFTDFSGKLDLDRANEIADYLCARFLSGETDEIYLVYNAFVSTAFYRPTAEKYLNLDPEMLLKNAPKEGNGALEYIFEPGPAEVFERLIPAYLKSKIFITLAEALTSEHSARMLAMNNASKNCDELADTLTLKMNKARQNAITKDLLDIVSGAEALKG